MKRFDALIKMQKNLSALESTVSGKEYRKNAGNDIFLQKRPFMASFLDFFRNWTLQRAWGFCVVINASKRFI